VSFEIHPGESVAEAARRVFAKETGKALDLLSGGRLSDKDVHDVRKRLKKARALLKLVREGLGNRTYKEENARFRDAGRPLTEVRDAAVLVETLDGLLDHSSAERGDPDVFRPIREALVRRSKEVSDRVLRNDATIPSVAFGVRQGRRRLKSHPVKGKGGSVVEAGLGRTYRQGQEAMNASAESRSAEHLHEWRKRVKDLWSELEFLKPLCPETLGPWADRSHELADALGDDHDLVVLGEVLEKELTVEEVGRAAVGRLKEWIGRRQEELRVRAFALGKEVYPDTPAVFLSRIDRMWKGWRAGRRAVACG